MSEVKRHSPARRLQLLRTVLSAGTALTVLELGERVGCSRHSILRYLKELHDQGEPLVEERDGAAKRWRMMPGSRELAVRISRAEIMALLFANKALGIFEGTGLDADLKSAMTKLSGTLRSSDVAFATNLDRKLLFVTSDGQRIYDGRADDVNDLLTALLNEEPIDVTYESFPGNEASFTLHPYTLVVYRGGLYFSGWCSHRKELRTFALDGFTSVTRRRGEQFDYPADFDPKSIPGAPSGSSAGIGRRWSCGSIKASRSSCAVASGTHRRRSKSAPMGASSCA